MNRLVSLTLVILTMLIGPMGTLNAQEDLIAPEEPLQPEEAVGGPIGDYVAGWTPTEGLFTYYTDEATRRVLISVPVEQMDRPFFLSTTLNRGTGSPSFSAPMMWGNMAFEFRRNGNSVEFVEPNYTITTVMGEPMARAVEVGISDTILGTVPIEVEDETDGRIVFDLAAFLLASSGIDIASWTWGYAYSVDLEGSYIENIDGFPLNDEIDARIPIYGAGDAVGFMPTGSQELGLHFSISEPPDPGYMPRLADDRVGYFIDMSLNYSVETDSAETRYVRYVNRFRLEKADPEAEISDPVEPIVFWLENTIPYEYRDAVRQGVLLWNDAFERIGFRNAVVVRQMPDDAEWDPADIRYNTVRWFVSPLANYAIGPSRSDPRTGEIYDADVGISADMPRAVYREYELSVESLRGPVAMMFPPGWPDLNGRQVRWDDNMIQTLESRLPIAAAGTPDLFTTIHAFEGARAAAILQSRGIMQPGSPEEEQFVYDYLVALTVHEVGHVLGLRHNFAGSSMTPYWNLHRRSWTREHGLSGSVMDYTSANVAPEGQLQGEYFQTSLGEYDYWAIEYAYAPIGAETPGEELEALQEIAGRAPQYRYGTDHDAYPWTRNMDPDLYYWDLTDDPVRYYGDRLTVSGQLIDRILDHWDEPGTRPSKIRLAFSYALWDYMLASMAVPRTIGGVRSYRDHVGDPDAHPAMVPVSAEEQRRALQFLDERIWSSEPFQFDPELLNMLARDRFETFDWMNLYLGTIDFELHDWVLLTQSEPFYWIYDPLVLQRMLNNEVRMPDGQEALTLVELFDTVRSAVWSEVEMGVPIDSFRRNLQRAHLEMITGIVLGPAYGTPEDAITLARHDLLVLRDQISTLLAGNQGDELDTMTAAHLDECLARIDLTLTAPMERGGDDPRFWLLY